MTALLFTIFFTTHTVPATTTSFSSSRPPSLYISFPASHTRIAWLFNCLEFVISWLEFGLEICLGDYYCLVYEWCCIINQPCLAHTTSIHRPVECAGLARYLSVAEVPNIPTSSHTSTLFPMFLILLMLFMFLNVPDVANAVHVCITGDF